VQLRSHYSLLFYIEKKYNPPQQIPITVTFWWSTPGGWEQNVGIGFAAPTAYQPSPTAVRYSVLVRVNWNSARARDGIEEQREEGVEQFYFGAGVSDVQLPPEWESKVYVPPGGISHSHWATATFAVVPPNQPPVAVASADPTVVAVGQSIQFSGEGSSDPDGDPLTYYWDFKDGGWSNDKNTAHTYAQPDIYKVTLTVHDPQSESDTAEVEVMAVGASFDRDPVLVGVAKTKTVTATISPSAGYGYVSFSTADPAVATVEPATADGPVQQLRVSGLKKGVTTLDARVNGEICGSLTVKVGHIDFVRVTPNPGYLVPGERTTFTAIGFAAVQGCLALPRGYAPDLATSLGAEVRFTTPQGADTRGIYLGPVKGRWKLEGGPNAEAFIPPDVPSENVSTVAVEAAAHAAGDISPDLFFYLSNGDGERVDLLRKPTPTVTVQGADQVIDGRSGGEFTAVVEGGTPTAYRWSFEFPRGVAHHKAKEEPVIRFTPPDRVRTRLSKIWWYADDNTTYAPSVTVSYIVICTVTLDTGRTVTGRKTLSVSAPQGSHGVTILSYQGLPTWTPTWRRSGNKIRVRLGNFQIGGLRRKITPKISASVRGTQWEDKARKHEGYHVEQFQGTKAPDLSSYYKVDRILMQILDRDFRGEQTSKTTTARMADAEIEAKIKEEAKTWVDAKLQELGRFENARFLRDWKRPLRQRELMERPAYEAFKDEEPVYFMHPDLEPWKKPGERR